MSSSTAIDPTPPAPRRTVRLNAIRPSPSHASGVHDTDYHLSHSAAMPEASVRLIAETRPGDGAQHVTPALDPEARALFLQRLRLCCLIAAVPFGFLSVCAATNFIDLFGRETVGWPGLALSVGTLAGLLTTAGFLARLRTLEERWLRVLEIAVFGAMGVCFAYWQFMVLTAAPILPDPRPEMRESSGTPTPARADRRGEEGREADGGFVGPLPRESSTRPQTADRELAQARQYFVLAAALITHFNWFALIVFHGVLVPNTLARGAGVALGMCALALTISAIAALVGPVTKQHAGVLFAVSVTILGAGAGLSIFGTAKTEALREKVREAQQAVREMGQYRLRKKLGHGGMGEVYLAEHRLLKRPCALKRIHPKYLNNAEQVRRFKREVEATSQLRHPNTVEIYDYGEADDGTFYYVMEYVPGLSLEDLVSKFGPMPPSRVVHLLRQVCGALREAHRYGLVHRDIKPSNILVFPTGTPHDQVKLLDFGLVHTPEYTNNEPQEKITREGLIVGTPEYMSPEQASGGKLDGRSDLFSLGSVAYYLLTGKEGFNRGNPVKTLMAVVGEEPAPITTINPLVPTDVLAVVRQCLTKPVAERYQSASELEADLERCLCATDWTEDRAAEWWAARPDSLAMHETDLDAPALRDGEAAD